MPGSGDSKLHCEYFQCVENSDVSQDAHMRIPTLKREITGINAHDPGRPDAAIAIEP
jgi:hypothetical protein